jgi:hypothetical protein
MSDAVEVAGHRFASRHSERCELALLHPTSLYVTEVVLSPFLSPLSSIVFS